MAWRKWIVRGIVYGMVVASATGALAYQRFTNPDAVRDQIITELEKAFPGAEVSVDSVGSSRVDLQACKLEYSIVSPK